MSIVLATPELLEELMVRWRALSLPVVGLLTPGLTDAEIDERAATLGLRLPGEARVWWRWHNGVPGSAIQYRREREITGGGLEFLPLVEAVEVAVERRRIAAEVAGAEAEELWRNSWLPFCVHGGGGAAVFDCARPGAPATPIYGVDPHRGGVALRRPHVASLGELVRWWLEAFDSGIYHWAETQPVLTADERRLDPRRVVSGIL